MWKGVLLAAVRVFGVVTLVKTPQKLLGWLYLIRVPPASLLSNLNSWTSTPSSLLWRSLATGKTNARCWESKKQICFSTYHCCFPLSTGANPTQHPPSLIFRGFRPLPSSPLDSSHKNLLQASHCLHFNSFVLQLFFVLPPLTGSSSFHGFTRRVSAKTPDYGMKSSWSITNHCCYNCSKNALLPFFFAFPTNIPISW